MTIINAKTVWATASLASHDEDRSNKRAQAPRSRFGVRRPPPSGNGVRRAAKCRDIGSLYRTSLKYGITEQTRHLPKALLL